MLNHIIFITVSVMCYCDVMSFYCIICCLCHPLFILNNVFVYSVTHYELIIITQVFAKNAGNGTQLVYRGACHDDRVSSTLPMAIGSPVGPICHFHLITDCCRVVRCKWQWLELPFA